MFHSFNRFSPLFFFPFFPKLFLQLDLSLKVCFYLSLCLELNYENYLKYPIGAQSTHVVKNRWFEIFKLHRKRESFWDEMVRENTDVFRGEIFMIKNCRCCAVRCSSENFNNDHELFLLHIFQSIYCCLLYNRYSNAHIQTFLFSL